MLRERASPQYEHGVKNPRNMSLEVAVRLADALGVRDLRKLLDGAPAWSTKRGGKRTPTKDEEMAAECAALAEQMGDDGIA